MSSELTLSQTIISSLNFSFKRKVPLILQRETTECGLACICMISNYYSFEVSLDNLRRKFNFSGRGVSLRSLIDVASNLGLSARPVKLEIEFINQLHFPCVIHWGLKHFVVLTRVRGNNFYINDPALGPAIVSRAEFREKFTGVALELLPTQSFKKIKSDNTIKMSDLWSKTIGLKRSLFLILSMSLLIQVFSLVSPLFLQLVIDNVISRSDFDLLKVLALGFTFLIILSVFTESVRSWIILQLSSKLSAQMASNLFRHLVFLPSNYFSARHVGDIVSRFNSLDRVKQALSNGLISAVVDGIMALITLIAMFCYSGKLALIVVLYVGMFIFIRYVTYQPIRTLLETEISTSSEANSHFMETIRTIETVKLLQLENVRMGEWQNRFFRAINKRIRMDQLTIIVDSANKFCIGVGAILTVYFGAYLIEASVLTIGMLYAFLSYAAQFTNSTTTLMTQLLEFRMLVVHLDRLSDIIGAEPDKTNQQKLINHAHKYSKNDQQDAVKIAPMIEVINAGFRYADNQPFVFRNINFRIESGEIAVLVGPSGCGKTTLLKCIAGLIKLTEGQLLIDGKPIDEIPNFRDSIGTVMQHDDLLAGDLYENISGFAPTIDTNDVVMCAHFANIEHEIFAMPMNFHTVIGDLGSGLSGGQKQRVLLARAFYRKPSILLLDEATSQLDVENEKLVSSNIKDIWPSTRVLVAHRPETIKSADRIIDIGTQH